MRDMVTEDEFIKFKTGKYAGGAIGFQWRRMDEGRVLWWYPVPKKANKICEPTRTLPAEVLQIIKKYDRLGGFAGMTVCQFIAQILEGV